MHQEPPPAASCEASLHAFNYSLLEVLLFRRVLKREGSDALFHKVLMILDEMKNEIKQYF